MAQSNQVHEDIHQMEALTELDRLRSDILKFESKPLRLASTNDSFTGNETVVSDSIGDGEEDSSNNSRSSFWSNLISPLKLSNNWQTTLRKRKKRNIKGVYLHGGVGCGKTFCMDLFYDSIRDEQDEEEKSNMAVDMSKQKVHFHKFMLHDVHREMHTIKQADPSLDADALLKKVVEKIFQRGQIICFDEFQVTDVADALILRRLFTSLLDLSAVLVITSNRPPCDLYLNGIQRDLFLPFIDMLKEKLTVVSMWDSETDYRLVHGKHKARGVYFCGDLEKEDFDAVFSELTKKDSGGAVAAADITTVNGGRRVHVPHASLEYAVARFSFDDLCRVPMGAADYLAVGEKFHTVFVDRVPSLSMNDVNVVRRFIVFVDSMYECHVKLIVHTNDAAKPKDIFQVDLDSQVSDESFAFDRTRSRLDEMGSEAYLKRRWAGPNSSKKGSLSSK
eukprot:CAMPEP_0195523986 /NCGR_PEP_ID=MMETSP0794_2-20130614/23538_1 /TAXON_ID=515487 /ORGANISM="Stephanopyxis turris, Strain CCMP 815" /LENGTH=447 /DNA_ID=CAMNT_0040654111 /DNA_START=350 /DNA_END=1693 /DNA_ORIENTATION=+